MKRPWPQPLSQPPLLPREFLLTIFELRQLHTRNRAKSLVRRLVSRELSVAKVSGALFEWRMDDRRPKDVKSMRCFIGTVEKVPSNDRGVADLDLDLLFELSIRSTKKP